VIAHECGHQAYSDSKTINNAVGWVLHSALLVPYHSWRITHGRHHAATAHMTRDEVHVPKTASQLKITAPENGFAGNVDDLLEDAPLYAFVSLVAQQLVGWPMYLLRNASGQKWYPPFTNHFQPSAIMFDKRHHWQIIASDVGLVIALSALTMWVRATSFWNVVCYYGIPYLFTNHWLVLITYLQHTDPELPHYRAGEWNFQRGALCTKDRHVFDFFTHDISSTHVLHHLSSHIPHYHAHEATEALKKVLGEHYAYTDENCFVSLWKNYRACRFVDDEGEVIFFRNAKGQARRKAADNTDSGVEL
jgi:omega-6 fatty acid desaturase (delta-12 desaturase)